MVWYFKFQNYFQKSWRERSHEKDTERDGQIRYEEEDGKYKEIRQGFIKKIVFDSQPDQGRDWKREMLKKKITLNSHHRIQIIVMNQSPNKI